MNATAEAPAVAQVLDLEPQEARPIVVQQQHAAISTPAQMLAVAVQQGATIEQMRELMQLEREWRHDQAVQAYNDAFAAFKSEAIEIIKRKRVHFTSQKGTTDYRHAELSDVIEAVTPALSRYGLSTSWSLKQEKDWLWVTCTLKHKAGHSDSATLGGPYDTSGNKNPVQAIASTKTMLERQTLKAVCGVSEKGDDDDGRGGHRSHGEMLADWTAKAEECATKADLDRTAKDGAAAFTKAKDVPGYAAFGKAVQARRAALGAGHA